MKLRDLAPGRLAPGHAVAFIIAISFVLRAGLAGVTGFSFDESYDVVAARSVALGYYDHPPLAMWLIASVVRLFGSEDNLVVRLPTLLLFGGTTFFIYRLTRLLFTPAAAVIAALVLDLLADVRGLRRNDCSDRRAAFFGLAAAAYFLAEALFRSEDRAVRRWWLLAGACFGLAALAKYSLFLDPVLDLPARRRPGIAAGCCGRGLTSRLSLALVVLSPAILWNVRHDWSSSPFRPGAPPSTDTFTRSGFSNISPLLPCSSCRPSGTGLILSLLDGLRRRADRSSRWLRVALRSCAIVFFAADLAGRRPRQLAAAITGRRRLSFTPSPAGFRPCRRRRLDALPGASSASLQAVVAALYLGFCSDAFCRLDGRACAIPRP